MGAAQHWRISMSKKEVERLEVVQRVCERRLSHAEASRVLGLSVRQTERLTQKYRTQGAAGLVSKHRGRRSNRRLNEGLKAKALALVRAKYSDFGPTFAAEKLKEIDGLDGFSHETLRKWMIEDELWVPRNKRQRRVHQPRGRRACLGELIQIDGCDHDWFEERAPRCTLLVYVDDATSRIMQMRFVISESTFDYFVATKSYIEEHGKPVAFYSDRASIFRVPKDRKLKHGTQFGRAMEALNIDVICANSSQAKGRVERAHLTLQDRLVKELRLRNISTLRAANAYATEFVEAYNRKFAKPPHSEHDAHRPMHDAVELDLALTWQEKRKVSKNLTVHYKRKLYLIEPSDETKQFINQQCTLHEWHDGRLRIRVGDAWLPFSIFDKNPKVQDADIVANKRLGAVLGVIQTQQKERDKKRMASKKITLRDKSRIAGRTIHLKEKKP